MAEQGGFLHNFEVRRRLPFLLHECTVKKEMIPIVEEAGAIPEIDLVSVVDDVIDDGIDQGVFPGIPGENGKFPGRLRELLLKREELRWISR